MTVPQINEHKNVVLCFKFLFIQFVIISLFIITSILHRVRKVEKSRRAMFGQCPDCSIPFGSRHEK